LEEFFDMGGVWAGVNTNQAGRQVAYLEISGVRSETEWKVWYYDPALPDSVDVSLNSQGDVPVLWLGEAYTADDIGHIDGVTLWYLNTEEDFGHEVVLTWLEFLEKGGVLVGVDKDTAGEQELYLEWNGVSSGVCGKVRYLDEKKPLEINVGSVLLSTNDKVLVVGDNFEDNFEDKLKAAMGDIALIYDFEFGQDVTVDEFFALGGYFGLEDGEPVIFNKVGAYDIYILLGEKKCKAVTVDYIDISAPDSFTVSFQTASWNKPDVSVFKTGENFEDELLPYINFITAYYNDKNVQKNIRKDKSGSEDMDIADFIALGGVLTFTGVNKAQAGKYPMSLEINGYSQPIADVYYIEPSEPLKIYADVSLWDNVYLVVGDGYESQLALFINQITLTYIEDGGGDFTYDGVFTWQEFTALGGVIEELDGVDTDVAGDYDICLVLNGKKSNPITLSYSDN
jgi:hypothetical protein